MKEAARERHHNDTIESWNDMRGFHVQLGLENGVHDRVRHLEQHGVFGSSKPIQQLLVLVGQGARATGNSPWRDEIVVDGQRCAPWVVGGVRTRKPPLDNVTATRPHSMQHLVRHISATGPTSGISFATPAAPDQPHANRYRARLLPTRL